MSGDEIKSPKVFISYSQDSSEHKNHIFELSNRLRADGIDCMIDLYVMLPIEGWPVWMIHQIQDANFILMICTERYYKRALGNEQAGIGHGVQWEANLLYNQFYDKTLKAKIIPILFDEKDHGYIPDPFRGVSNFCLTTATGYDDLYRLLTGQQLYQKPDLGEIRKLPPLERKDNFFTYNPVQTLNYSLEPLVSESRENSDILAQSFILETEGNLTGRGQFVDNNSDVSATLFVADTSSGQQSDIITLANQYYTDIEAGSSIVGVASKLFMRQKIYPDECRRVLSAIRTISKPLQELETLATQNPAYFSQTRYELLRTLHLIEAALLDLDMLKNIYCPGCPHAPMEQRQDILHNLEEILKSLDKINDTKQALLS